MKIGWWKQGPVDDSYEIEYKEKELINSSFCKDVLYYGYFEKQTRHVPQDPYMVYLPTWMVDFYGLHVGKYASPMDLWLWVDPYAGIVIPSLRPRVGGWILIGCAECDFCDRTSHRRWR